MKLKGKRAITNRDVDCTSSGGPFIPKGCECTILVVHRDMAIGRSGPKKVATVEFDGNTSAQHNLGIRKMFLNDLEIQD